MGGGEVVRYLGTYGSKRVSKAVLIGVVPPFLLKRDDNPEGALAQTNVDDIVAAIHSDRPAYMTAFFADFYNLDENLGKRVSDEVVRANLECRHRRRRDRDDVGSTHLGHRLPGRRGEDRRPDADRPWDRRPDSADRRHSPAAGERHHGQ